MAIQELKREYIRVSSERRMMLIKLVFFECIKIKEASETLCIKYPAAKTIIIMHRRRMQNKFKKNFKLTKRCTFKTKSLEISQMNIESRINGQLI